MTMLRIARLSAIIAALMLVAVPTFATNVALNDPVTLNGQFFTGGWGAGLVASPDTITDGAFFPRSTQWDQGPVWWDSTFSGGQNIVIDLGGAFMIDSFVVQADDNDAYNLFYHNIPTDTWQLAWHIPAIGGWGMQTRPNPSDNTARYMLPATITTDALKIEGDYPNSDLLFSVSEVQAFGTPVPEPSTLLMAGAGLAGLALARRRHKS
jgi:hypothetical protein